MGDVLGDLAALGYDTEWDCVPAAAVGAPHLRDRAFILAYAHGSARLGSGFAAGTLFRPGPIWELRPAQSGVGRGVDGFSAGLDGSWGIDWGDGLERVARGVPARLDRLRALGNAVVPQVAQFVGELIMEGES